MTQSALYYTDNSLSSDNNKDSKYLCLFYCKAKAYHDITRLYLQTIETDGAAGGAAFTIAGTVYLFIANHGSPGRHETTSRVYTVAADGTLSVVS